MTQRIQEIWVTVKRLKTKIIGGGGREKRGRRREGRKRKRRKRRKRGRKRLQLKSPKNIFNKIIEENFPNLKNVDYKNKRREGPGPGKD